MEAKEEQPSLAPKRKYTRRVPICTDPELKYRYKPKPGPRKGLKKGRKVRKTYQPERTDAEQRRFSRMSTKNKKAAETYTIDPKVRAAPLLKHHKENPAAFSRRGIPDGMNREQAEAAWAKARAQAEKVFNTMVEQGIVAGVTPDDFERVLIQRGEEVIEIFVPKNDEAKAALMIKEACVMALGPMGTQQTRLAAIRTVLEWTKSKPAAKVEASVSKAEDLLAAALADIHKDGGS